MNEKELRNMLEDLQGAIHQSNPTVARQLFWFGRRGEGGLLGIRISTVLESIWSREARQDLRESLLEAELTIREQNPALANALRTAVNILENSGI
jgi:hypothetical protein